MYKSLLKLTIRMDSYSTNKKISLINSLFITRKDVFAIYWQKPGLAGTGGDSKSGYMPAYKYDPYMYRLHKMKGGSFRTYNDKTYLPLSNQQILKHLNGEQLIGIYPLLPDNTCLLYTSPSPRDG